MSQQSIKPREGPSECRAHPEQLPRSHTQEVSLSRWGTGKVKPRWGGKGCPIRERDLGAEEEGPGTSLRPQPNSGVIVSLIPIHQTFLNSSRGKAKIQSSRVTPRL